MRDNLGLIDIVSRSYSGQPDPRWAGEYTEVFSLREDSSKGLVLSSDTEVIVAFPGTDDWGDALLDVLALKVRFLGGHVHAGFLHAYQDLQHQLHASMMLVNPCKAKPITLCGHSLGGAIAMLAASDMHAWRYPVKEAVVFGCPRVGDKEWTRNLEATGIPVRAYLNHGDVVPALPPLPGYARLPGSLSLGGNATSTFSWRLLWYFIAKNKGSHSLAEYASGLREAQP